MLDSREEDEELSGGEVGSGWTENCACHHWQTHIACGQPINRVELEPAPLSKRDNLELQIPQSVLWITRFEIGVELVMTE